MKPIGPYVAVSELPGGQSGPIRTLRATDRLTGMPVLLHLLPYALNLPDIPQHPNLLPIVDSGMDGDSIYVVTELPPHAQPAREARTVARGVLKALDALHGRGLAHGGVQETQLWTVGQEVALAGAGLPWRDTPATPGGDLRDLALTLQRLGDLPLVLRDVLDGSASAGAAELLASLEGRPVVKDPAPAVPELTVVPSGVPSSSGGGVGASLTSVPLQPESGKPDGGQGGSPADSPEPLGTIAPPPAPHDGSPIILGRHAQARDETKGSSRKRKLPKPKEPKDVPRAEAPVETAGSRQAGDAQQAPPPAQAPAEQSEPAKPALESRAQATSSTPSLETSSAASTQPQFDPTEQPRAPEALPTAEQGTAQPTEPEPSDSAAARPVPAYSTAPAGTVETPQERRRRQNEERRAQAILDAKAAAERKAQRLRSEAQQRPAPAVVRIGAEGGQDDLPPLPDPDSAPGHPRLRMRDVERLPPSLRRPVDECDPAEATEELPTTFQEAGHLPTRHLPGGPIRIGWDEDDSWRVVKALPNPPQPALRLPRWLLPLILLVALLGAGYWAYRSGNLGVFSASTAPATQTYPVRFTVRGAPGQTAQLSVNTAPPQARLNPGDPLGTAPATINFPAPGTYQLTIKADGHQPMTVTLSVPRAKPYVIELRE